MSGGVTSPRGFVANGVSAGIKISGKLDLGLLYSETEAVAAGLFTTNVFKASPVSLSIANLKNETHKAIIVNSGNANCANGLQGDNDAIAMVRQTAKRLGLSEKEVLVASTGIIGHRLPLKNIQKKIPELVSGLSENGGRDFARAILTTDTMNKEATAKLEIGGKIVRIGGAAKGVAMIHPRMEKDGIPLESESGRHATLLGFITTDAAISKAMLEKALLHVVNETFNMISTDGDTSTNDSLFIMANGLAGNERIESDGKDYEAFLKALKGLCMSLAKMLVKDGEGATKLLEISVVGAETDERARILARRISTSNLLKCAIFREDPNWGRVAAAAGSAGVNFNPERTDIYLGAEKVLSNGSSLETFDKIKLKKYLEEKEVFIKVDLKSGKGSATAWTCDLSNEYATINTETSP